MAKQADVNEQLRKAVREGNEDTVRLLLKERGNPNCSTCKYSDNNTLLMMASGQGYKSIVQLLVKSGGNVNETSNDGGTALHWAAMGGHHDIVLYLIVMEANVNAVDESGWTPLHEASWKGHAGTVLVLLENKANPNFPNMDGNTPLHFAAKWNKAAVIDVLLKNKADADCRNKDGDTPLHLAAMLDNAAAIDVLLKNKADADCRNKKGKWPYQLAEDGQLKRILQEQRFAVLYAAGTVKPKVMKLCVIGAAGAGKTTLVAALKRGWFKSVFTSEKQPDDPTCEFERTMGINVMTVDIPGVGRFSLFDYAGQEQFHKTHGFFFSAANSSFILLISLLTGEERQPCTLEELIHLAQYWLSFLRGSLEKHIIPTVTIAASRGDCCPNGQRLLQQVVCHLRDVFKGKINISEDSFLLDCRKSWSPQMKKLREFLKQARDQFMQSGIRYPRLCEPVTRRLLPALRKKQQDPFIEEEELVSTIEREECPGQHKEVIHKVVDFLDESGEIIKVDNVISLSPIWLSEYALGPLIAPKEMKHHAKAPNGKMTREEAERAINQYLRDLKINVNINIDKIFKLLQDLGLMFRLEDGTYMFPTHLPPKMLSEMWKRMDEAKVYVGRRYFCSSPTSIFNPSTFVLFQCQVSVNLDIKSLLWRDGIVVARARKSHVQCLAVMFDRLRAVDIVARGKEGSESECLSLLNDVMKEWVEVVKKHSPGTDYEMAYLSRKHLSEHKHQPAVYSQEEVNKAKNEGPSAFVTHDIDLSEQLSDLLVFPLQQPPTNIPDAEILQHCQDKATQQEVSDATDEHICPAANTDPTLRQVDENLSDMPLPVAETGEVIHSSEGISSSQRSQQQQTHQQKVKSSTLMKQDISSRATSENVDIEDLKSAAGEMRVSEVIEAVVKHGNDQWYEIGLALELADAAIRSETHTIPNYSGKLRAIIEMKRKDVGYEGLRHALVKVCFKVDTPIAGDVRDELLEMKKASQN